MNYKLIVAFFVGAISANQLPNINMQSQDSFRQQDLNGDGFITIHEAVAFAQSKGYDWSYESQAGFDRIDKNKDGKISWAEYSNGRGKLNMISDTQQFREMDLNKDGWVTPEEKQNWYNGIGWEWTEGEQEWFDYQDKNRDGKLSWKEFSNQGRGQLNMISDTQQFREMDLNKDGWVTPEEKQNWYNGIGWEWTEGEQEWFDYQDKNRDGKLSWKEFSNQGRGKLNMIDLTVAPAGQQAIAKEYGDVDAMKQPLQQDPSFQAMAKSVEVWGDSAEVQTSIKQLQAWSETQQAKDLETAGHSLEYEIKGAVSEIPNGVRIANAKLPSIEARVEALQRKIEALEPTAEMQKAFESKSFEEFQYSQARFGDSVRGRALQKELQDLVESIQTHVKVADVPK